MQEQTPVILPKLLRIPRNSSQSEEHCTESSDLWMQIRLRTIRPTSSIVCEVNSLTAVPYQTWTEIDPTVPPFFFAGHFHLSTTTTSCIIVGWLKIVFLHKCLQLCILSCETFKSFTSAQLVCICTTVVDWASSVPPRNCWIIQF
jgi:hypothetical protein